MSIESEDFMDWADGAQRELERRLERMREEEKEVDNYLMAIEVARELMSENKKQTAGDVIAEGGVKNVKNTRDD